MGADFHLGAFQYGLHVREDDYQRAFDSFVSQGIALPDTDLVLLGDIGDLPHEGRLILHRIRKGASEAVAAGRTVWYIGGNHDCDKPSLPVALGMAGFVDAEQAFYAALDAGEAFRPYGPDGPKVCALHSTGFNELWTKLRDIRARETEANRSTELWLHQAILPGAKVKFAEFNAVDFVNMGWHTIFAGDIHNGGVWAVPGNDGVTGMLAYPGSPEMTDINESLRGRGFLLHRPIDSEPVACLTSVAVVPYQHRPYRTFVFEGDIIEPQLNEVIEWAAEAQRTTGMKPIVRIESTNAGWRNHPTLLPHTLKLLFKRPERQSVEMVPTAPAEVLLDGTIGGGNASHYAVGQGSLFQKLSRVLARSNLPPEVKALGEVVLANPVSPQTWVAAAEASGS